MGLPLSRIENWVPGEEVDASDLQDLASWTRMKDSILAFSVAGVNAFLPAFNNGGIACVPGSGLQVLLKAISPATSCRIFLPQRSDDGGWTSVNSQDGQLAQAAYYTPPGGGYIQDIATPPSSAAPYRTDLIAVQFNAEQVSPHTVNVRSGTLVSPQTCYAIDDTLTFTYVPGTPSTTFPAPTPATPAKFAALYTVYVQNGDVSMAPDDITLVMPTYDAIITSMTGPGMATLTADAVIPSVYGSVNLHLSSAIVFPPGANGIAVGAEGTNAMYFSVTARTGNIITVTNNGPVIGYNNATYTMHGGSLSYVGFGAPLPYTYTTQSLALPQWGTTVGGLSISNSLAWQPGQCGFCIGPTVGHAFRFIVLGVNQSGLGTIDIYCIEPVWGNIGGTINRGALLYPTDNSSQWLDYDATLAAYVTPHYHNDDSPFDVQPIKIEASGRIVGLTSGSSTTVTLPVTFGNTDDYRVISLVMFASSDPTEAAYCTAKTTSTITVKNPSSVTMDIEWSIRGSYLFF